MEQATLDKPEVLRAAEMLGIPRREALGLFIEFWIWLDKNLSGNCPDFVRNMSRKSLDEVLHCPGFSGVLMSVGWAKFDDEKAILYVTNADRHNGTTAKTRALDAKRKKEKRRENVPEMSVSKPDKNGTREEKRREDIKPPLSPKGEEAVPGWLPIDAWTGYVEMRAKIRKPMTDRAKTLAIRKLASLKAKGFDPAAVLDEATANSWQGLYEPKGRAGADQFARAV